MIYIEKVMNDRPEAERSEYPYSIPVIKELYELEFRKSVTFITGENGTGKSTLIEAIAISAGFNPEGGSIYMNYSTYDTHSSLYNDIRLVRAARRNRDGYFLRAESFYNVASETDRISDRKPARKKLRRQFAWTVSWGRIPGPCHEQDERKWPLYP